MEHLDKMEVHVSACINNEEQLASVSMRPSEPNRLTGGSKVILPCSRIEEEELSSPTIVEKQGLKSSVQRDREESDGD